MYKQLTSQAAEIGDTTDLDCELDHGLDHVQSVHCATEVKSCVGARGNNIGTKNNDIFFFSFDI